MNKHTWDLSALFKSDTDPSIAKWRKTVQSATDKFTTKWRKDSSYLTNSKKLRAALDEYNHWLTNYSDNNRETLYFHLRSEQNETDSKIKAKLNQAIQFSQKLDNQVAFFTINISKINQATQKQLLKDKQLAPYRRLLETLFVSGKHTLSEPEEKIMTLKSAPASYNWVRMTSSLLATENVNIKDDTGKVVSQNLNQLFQLLTSRKKSVRDAAVKEIDIILTKYADVAENEINSILQNKQTNDELRGFARPDASRHLEDDINSKTVDTLVKAVSKNYRLAHDYYQLKAKMLGQTKLAYHERNIELGKSNTKYPYADTCKLIIDTFGRLDPQFASLTKSFIDENRIDVFSRPGKTGGAFCAHGLKTEPIYLLLNHSDRLDDVLTMAHELGHGIHYELAKIHQPAVYYSASLATAEVASTFMEDFVLDTILQTADEQTQLDLLMMKLNSDISTIFRQIACYQFETELHAEFRKQGYLNKDAIGKIFGRHMAAYMGKAVDQPQSAQNWWVYWSHIRNFFYVYSYANGLLISKSLQRMVRKNPSSIAKVKEFMSAGSSAAPEAIFKQVGIDITSQKFWEEGIAEIQEQLKIAKLLAKKLRRI